MPYMPMLVPPLNWSGYVSFLCCMLTLSEVFAFTLHFRTHFQNEYDRSVKAKKEVFDLHTLEKV